MTGIIIKALSGFYYVLEGDTVYECKARGSFRKSGVSPLVGDRVEILTDGGNKGTVEKIEKRKNQLSRPPLANIDKLFIVSAFSSPKPNTVIIDKLTAIAEYNNIEPVIVFNKCDEGDFSLFEAIYRKAGYKTFTVSAKTGEGIDGLKDCLKNSVSAFTGNSGVGKSSILNVIFGNSDIATGEVSEKLGRGRHTTRHTELYRLSGGGFIADTPGFSSLDSEACDYNFKENLEFCFKEFADFIGKCRFTSCTHTKESGCAVLEAVKSGEISESRHRSYAELFEEMKDFKEWQHKNKQ